MKRGGPLKRKTALKQGAPLKRSTSLKQGAQLKKTPLRTRPPRQADGVLVAHFFATVTTTPSRDGKTRVPAGCVVCGRTAGLDPHHVLPKQMLKRIATRLRYDDDQTDALVWDPRDGIPLCRRCHDEHETANRRVERWRLPASAWEFIAYVDTLVDTDEINAYVERTYP